MEKIEKIVPDTSIIIEGFLSESLKKKEIQVQNVFIHDAVLAELEHQANFGKEIGFIGLEELKELRDLRTKLKFEIKYLGRRPKESEIKRASSGEIDSLIRDLAFEEEATLLTADKVQSKVAEAKGIKVIYHEPAIKKRKLKLESFFDKQTMSVHLKENLFPHAKKGVPGNWKFTPIMNEKLTFEELRDISKEIIEDTKMRKDGFLEIERRGSTILQLGEYRIVITRPPLSDTREITAVRPIRKMILSDYKLNEKLKERISEKAEGILIAGSPGEGKSSFASALAEFYAAQQKVVKTIESPRDLQLGEHITQYSISHASSQEIHDILLLSRPDYVIFDEMRNTDDFHLFTDLRLSGIGLAGVLHATNPIDAIQRFIGRTELGVIPQIIDTVIFIKGGMIHTVLNLKISVKVPTGMTEADLARPVVEVTNFLTGKLEFEIYTYGEQTVVIPVHLQKTSPSHALAKKQLERELQKYVSGAKAELVSEHKAILYVPEKEIPAIIGKQGKRIEHIEKELGISLEVKPLHNTSELNLISYNVSETQKYLVFHVSSSLKGKKVGFYLEDAFLFAAIVGNKADVNVQKKSNTGSVLLESINLGKRVDIKL